MYGWFRSLIVAGYVFAHAGRAADDYVPGSDSLPQPGVPKGEVTQYTFAKSVLFPGTTRDYWVYVPRQYDPAKPACVMVFQDGIRYQAPTVFDNLLARKEIPVLIGVFVQPGVVPAATTNALPRFNRSFEYDGLGDRYARFLLEELLPEVAGKYSLSPNGNDRAIAGESSGAICAFTVAWERPDAFRRVFSSIGTYVGLRGGNDYPTLIRKTEPKPIRIFLQDGSGDLNIYGGDWWVANQDMLSALRFAGYAVTNVWGDGGHNGKHATAIFPDVLRWLWRDWPAPVRANPEGNSRQPLMDILIPGEDWQVVGSGFKFTEGPAANAQGEVFFTDIPNNRIHRIDLEGKITVFVEETGGANGLMFGPDGRLYACQSGRKRIVAYDPAGNEAVLAEGIDSNDLAVTHRGGVYVTDPPHKQVWFISPEGEKRVVDTNEKGGLAFPNGVRLTPDQTQLLVADMRGQFVWALTVLPDGSLTNKQPFHHLHCADAAMESGADGMTLDTEGRLYVTSRLGLQVCDPAGRVNAIIPRPQNQWLANVALGGKNFSELYVTCSDKVYKRRTKARGVLSSQPPLLPPKPRL